MGIISSLSDYTSASEMKRRIEDVRNEANTRAGAIISAHYTMAGSSGLMQEKEYWQLVEAYKSWVYTAIDKIGKSVAMIPLKLLVYRSKQTGKVIRDISWKSYYRNLKTDEEIKYFFKNLNLSREEIFSHSFLDLLNHPNNFMTRFMLWYNTIIRLELGGLCPWLKIRDGLNIIREIYPLPLTKYAKITPKVLANMTLEYWEYRDGDVLKHFKPEDICLMIYPHPASPFQGMSPLMAQTYPYDIDLYLMQQQKAFFEHGANPGLHMTTDQRLNENQVKELKELIDEQYAGALKSGETLVTHSGMKSEKLGQTGREAMIDVVARYARDKLITAFDLSPGKVGLVEDINRANMQGLDRIFIHECLRPKCMLIEEAIETFLLPDYDKGLTCDFELPSTEDQEFELKAMETRLRNYVTVVNEERERLGMEPKRWGDAPWIPFSLMQVPGGTLKPGNGTPEEQGKLVKAMDADFWTEDRKDIHWKMFVAKSEKLEQIFLLPMRQYFKSQCEEIIRRLDKEGRKIIGQYAGWSKKRVLEHLKENKANLRAINIDRKKEKEVLLEKFIPIAKTIMKEYGDERIRELTNTIKGTGETEIKAVAIEFNVNDPRVLRWLGSKMRRFSEEVSGTTFDEIEAILREGFSEGQPLVNISETLREKFGAWDKYRAPLIARTETLSAMSYTDLESVRQLDLEKKVLKSWLSARDDHCRPTHEAADIRYSAEPIEIDEYFVVGGDRMLCPGNGQKPEENINCRCTLIYFEKESEE